MMLKLERLQPIPASSIPTILPTNPVCVTETDPDTENNFVQNQRENFEGEMALEQRRFKL